MRPVLLIATALLLTPWTALHAAEAPAGYPKPVSFRAATPELLRAMGGIQMLVSDLLSDDRRGVEEAFKRLHPERTVLIQHDGVDGAWMFLTQQQLEDWGV
jgi:hypothetical protein